jgi:hypothetical protein
MEDYVCLGVITWFEFGRASSVKNQKILLFEEQNFEIYTNVL